MIDIIASIVTYKNDKKVLKKTMDSFLKTELRVRLFVIDNSPTDDLRATCADPRIEYIFNNKNLGFGAGHNITIRKTGYETKYFLILNPDVYFNPGTLEALFAHMEKNPQIGSIMPKVLYPDGSLQYLCRLLPNPADVILRKFRNRALAPVVDTFSRYELRRADHNKPMNVPYLSGCFMFIRAEILKKTGLFDERFFLYFEDVDLSRRIHELSDTLYYPQVSIYHAYARGSDKSFRHLKYLASSAIKYFNKWGWIFDKERTLANTAALKKYCA